MKNKFISVVVLMASLAVGHAYAKENDANIISIKLLEGYVLKGGWGTDSYFGTIAKKDGLTIHFDTGIGAGVAPGPKSDGQFKWHKTQTINGEKVYLAITNPDKEGVTRLIVFYDNSAAIFSTKISSTSDVAEALAMILTYKPLKWFHLRAA